VQQPIEHPERRPCSGDTQVPSTSSLAGITYRRHSLTIRPIDAPATVPAPDGTYTAGIHAGGFLFLAGQGPFDANGQRVGDTIKEQINKTLDNLEQVARAAGASLDQVVRFGVYLNTMDDVDALNECFAERIRTPFPARTTIVTQLPGFDVEIDAILVVS
jgi:2-iminobutanoate/2-iminopropanoate deaminase